jgi:3-isopropylmalate/(R)-2-methylmalate dehydratase small subunit
VAKARIRVELASQTVTASDGKTFAFEVDAFKKHCLMNGLDDIGLTLEKATAIDAYEMKNAALRPWA